MAWPPSRNPPPVGVGILPPRRSFGVLISVPSTLNPPLSISGYATMLEVHY